VLVLVFYLCPSSVRVVATFPGTVLFPLLCSVLPCVLFCYDPIGRIIQSERGEHSGANAVLLRSTGTGIGLSQRGTKISKFNTLPYANKILKNYCIDGLKIQMISSRTVLLNSLHDKH